MTQAHADFLSASTRSFLAKNQGLLIDGRWRAAETGGRFATSDPADGSVITDVAAATAADVNAAVAAARRSFTDRRWRGLTPAARARVMWKLADLIDANAELLAQLETLDGGKPFMAARHGEVPAAAECFRYYAGFCTKIEGRTREISAAGRYFCYTRAEPAGVCGLIVPWNGPLVIGAWKLVGSQTQRHFAAVCSIGCENGQDTGKTAERHTSAEFVDFLEQVVSGCKPQQEIHIILDNLSAHKTTQLASS